MSANDYVGLFGKIRSIMGADHAIQPEDYDKLILCILLYRIKEGSFPTLVWLKQWWIAMGASMID